MYITQKYVNYNSQKTTISENYPKHFFEIFPGNPCVST